MIRTDDSWKFRRKCKDKIVSVTFFNVTDLSRILMDAI